MLIAGFEEDKVRGSRNLACKKSVSAPIVITMRAVALCWIMWPFQHPSAQQSELRGELPLSVRRLRDCGGSVLISLSLVDLIHTSLPQSWCEVGTEVVLTDVWPVTRPRPDKEGAFVLILTQQVERLRLPGKKA